MSSENQSKVDTERVIKILRQASERADVPYVIMAKYIGVTQAALSRWVQGKSKPRPRNFPRVVEVLRAVARLVNAGKLPITPPPRTRREKIRAVDALLAEELGVKPEPESEPEETSQEPADPLLS